MSRAFYKRTLAQFLKQTKDEILGELARNNHFVLQDTQRNSWLEEIRILQTAMADFNEGHIILEYTIPRIGSRVDAIYIVDGLIFVLEFKIGERDYPRNAIDQVTDYALDLKNFHKRSHDKLLVPILICTNAPQKPFACQWMKNGILNVLQCNSQTITEAIATVRATFSEQQFSVDDWINSPYAPTPTIIEAAQALYRNHNVVDISRNDAAAINLAQTTSAINNIIENSKKAGRKSICFITGVPGAGKTLAGLNIANERHKFDEDEHAVFLSGNQPLVDVLQEALAQDEHKRLKTLKSEAKTKAKAFIQIIHHFRDDAISTDIAPTEKVVIFDEAQRAWTKKMLSGFMARKKGIPDFLLSEPEFLIDIMDRHQDWAVIICLIGGGQEINTGEAGLIEWFDALRYKFKNWDVYLSSQITDNEYTRNLTIDELFGQLIYTQNESLHLSVSLRSFRSEKVAGFVKSLLDVDIEQASNLYALLRKDYPIVITRNLLKAKNWVKSQAKGTERYGIIASSGGRRLRPYGIWVQNKIDAATWFLGSIDDVRSSYFLEETATEFDIQGLELDWTIVAWDGNFRFWQGEFGYFQFKGKSWMNINNVDDKLYLKNAYRVLLTRARQGMVIFIPNGNESDPTRPSDYYDGTYNYLKGLGIEEL